MNAGYFSYSLYHRRYIFDCSECRFSSIMKKYFMIYVLEQCFYFIWTYRSIGS